MTTSRLNTATLRCEMAKRGLHASDLAGIARLSTATVCNALRGRRVSHGTLRKVAAALLRIETIPGIEDLVLDDYEGDR